jgi:exodeoxyribonuclease V gamma subunit
MPAFHLHRSNRLERLVTALGDLLAEPVGGPLLPEAVVVQGRGMAIWLGSQMAQRFSVWAAPMLYPRELVERLVGEVLGEDTLGDAPLSEDLLGWAIQAVLPELLPLEEFAALRGYSEGDAEGVRTAQLAGRIATVFDQYLTYRPDWIHAWEAGDLSAVGAGDRWQPLLWKVVAERLGRSNLGAACEQMLERLGQSQGPWRLPPRVLLFGVSTLPPLYVRVLAALSRHVDVHLFSFSPAPGFWPCKLGEPKRAGGRPELEVDNALLASLGMIGADFDRVLAAELARVGVARVDHDLHEAPARGSLLAALQADLHAIAPASAPKLGRGSEHTISVHSCHGPMREVEVLHDQLLALLTRKEGRVAPDEVVVLVPDLPTYAPLIEAVFAREMGREDFIPYHVSDRSEQQGSPVLDGLLRVMGMVRGRVTASDVFDLLVLEPVQRRFRLDAAGIETLRGWVGDSGVRWGMDGAHREQMGVPEDEANTWRFGLRRLMLGYAVPSRGDELVNGALPFDGVEGKPAELLGTLAWFTRTLFGWLHELEQPRPIKGWASTLVELGAALFATGRDGAKQMASVSQALDAAVSNATAAGFEGKVDVQVLHELLRDAAAAAGADRGFLSGGVTFCAMVPMRSIPFRVVGLLGMNDGDFPRAPRPIELDLVRSGKLPQRPGDRSPRDDDRYLFLETLCAARERLVITFTGQGVRDNRPRPPSVCVAELLDYLAARCDLPPCADPAHDEPGDRARSAFVVRHPLQGFSPRYFDRSDARLFSHSKADARAAQSMVTVRHDTRLFLEGSLAPVEAAEVRLDDLVKFFKSPPATFLNRRLGLYLKQEEGGMSDREPLELGTLDEWKLGMALVGHLLAERPIEEAETLLRAAGDLPLGHSGTLELEELRPTCEAIKDAVQAARGGGPAEPLEVRVELPGGKRVTGAIGDRWANGVVRHTYSKLKSKYLLEGWIRHLALCAGSAAGERTVWIGRGKNGGAEAVEWRALSHDEAARDLGELVRLYHQGLERPLRFTPESSREYVDALGGGKDALREAVKAYDEGDHCETAYDPHLARAFSDMLPPFDPEVEAGRKRVEETEFHKVALAVYAPLKAAQAMRPEAKVTAAKAAKAAKSAKDDPLPKAVKATKAATGAPVPKPVKATKAPAGGKKKS